MVCSMKENCCKQASVCPQNTICKPLDSLNKPWKRFTCECPDGYHEENCEQPITTCKGYAQGSQISGIYKVRDSSDGSLYEVYCHFDSDGAWTLVQSFSFANHTVANSEFKKPLTEDLPVSENDVTWSGYRLRKARMQLINENSNQLRFTWDFNDVQNVNQTDYLQISLDELESNRELTTQNPNTDISSSEGKVNGIALECKIKIHQNDGEGLHVHTDDCDFNPTQNLCSGFRYFSFFPSGDCMEQTHR